MSDLTIVGASARAAAASARRAGLVPWTADLFADSDLRAMVPGAVRCPADRYPRALLDILQNGPPGPWMYTGGLENYPDLIRRMAEVRPLWGTGPDALAACRSPRHIERLLREAGLPVPEVRAANAALPDDRRWLRKPLRGAAGQGIAFAEIGPGRQKGRRSAAIYYQQFVPGPAMSAVYVRARGQVQLLGVTEQLIGEPWLNAPPFRYAGNVGPVPIPDELQNDLSQVGRVLGDGCDMLGLFGVDFILHDGRPWVVEVNPRYPASVEVLELATGMRAISLHRVAFDAGSRPAPRAPAEHPVIGKAILYARCRLVVPPFGLPDLADVPAPWEVIEPGWPVLTVLAAGQTDGECRTVLRERARQVETLLNPVADWDDERT